MRNVNLPVKLDKKSKVIQETELIWKTFMKLWINTLMIVESY